MKYRLFPIAILVVLNFTLCTNHQPQIKTISSEGIVSLFKYDDAGNIVEILDKDSSDNKTTRIKIQRKNNVVSVSDGERNPKEYYLNENGYVIQHTTHISDDYEYLYKYDSLSRLSEVIEERYVGEYKNNLFVRTNNRFLYDNEYLTKIISEVHTDQKFGFGEGWSSETNIIFDKNLIGNNLLVEYIFCNIDNISVPYYLTATGKHKNALIQTIQSKVVSEKSRITNFTYKLDNKKNIIQISQENIDQTGKKYRKNYSLDYY